LGGDHCDKYYQALSRIGEIAVNMVVRLPVLLGEITVITTVRLLVELGKSLSAGLSGFQYFGGRSL
jgi:hypothetical protein